MPLRFDPVCGTHLSHHFRGGALCLRCGAENTRRKPPTPKAPKPVALCSDCGGPRHHNSVSRCSACHRLYLQARGQEALARKRANRPPRKKVKPKRSQQISFHGAGHGKDTRSRPCSYCGEVAHYVAGGKGYCREHRNHIPGLRLSVPSEHELSLLRELVELRAWTPMSSG